MGFTKNRQNINKSLFKKIPLQNIQFYTIANNLGILWKANKAGLDPDYDIANMAYPPPKSYAIGLKMGF